MSSLTIVSGFNPRSHEGSDRVIENGGEDDGVSIHAPTKGATFDSFIVCLFPIVSIHAPTKGAT